MANTEANEGSVLEKAARKIGGAAGKVAGAVGVTGDAVGGATSKRAKPGKLEKKNKSRLPRKEKKAAQKAAAKIAG